MDDNPRQQPLPATPEKNPFTTPKKPKASYDRFITNSGGSITRAAFSYLSSAEEKSPTKQKSRNTGESDISRREESRNQIYHDVLVNEVLPNASPLGRVDMMKRGLLSYSNGTEYRTHDKSQESPLSKHNGSRLSLSSQKVLQTPKKLVRYISKTPFKVLDAPELQDDFYLNLVDWSSTNILAVGLGSCVYLWAANTSKVFKVLIIDELCDLSPHDSITSVNWMQRGTHLAVGTSSGIVQLWDSSKMKKVRQFKGHEARVGSMTWNESILSSGSRDRSIIQHDVRDSSDSIAKLAGHRQEVCGLKWNPEGTQMASGGNDNKLLIWDARNPNPIANFTDHTAAVKAIAWSPQQHGILASGGGTADRTIRFWNTSNNTCINSIDTGSQVCNLAWSKNSSELVSTHGYSQNHISIWKYPSMDQIALLTGHTYRVLYLSMSPDGQNIVTGAGDETLRFWTVFNKSRFKNSQSYEKGRTLR